MSTARSAIGSLVALGGEVSQERIYMSSVSGRGGHTNLKHGKFNLCTANSRIGRVRRNTELGMEAAEIERDSLGNLGTMVAVVLLVHSIFRSAFQRGMHVQQRRGSRS